METQDLLSPPVSVAEPTGILASLDSSPVGLSEKDGLAGLSDEMPFLKPLRSQPKKTDIDVPVLSEVSVIEDDSQIALTKATEKLEKTIDRKQPIPKQAKESAVLSYLFRGMASDPVAFRERIDRKSESLKTYKEKVEPFLLIPPLQRFVENVIVGSVVSSLPGGISQSKAPQTEQQIYKEVMLATPAARDRLLQHDKPLKFLQSLQQIPEKPLPTENPLPQRKRKGKSLYRHAVDFFPDRTTPDMATHPFEKPKITELATIGGAVAGIIGGMVTAGKALDKVGMEQILEDWVYFSHQMGNRAKDFVTLSKLKLTGHPAGKVITYPIPKEPLVKATAKPNPLSLLKPTATGAVGGLITQTFSTLGEAWIKIYKDYQKTQPFEDAVSELKPLPPDKQTPQALKELRQKELRSEIIRLGNAGGSHSELKVLRNEYRQLIEGRTPQTQNVTRLAPIEVVASAPILATRPLATEKQTHTERQSVIPLIDVPAAIREKTEPRDLSSNDEGVSAPLKVALPKPIVPLKNPFTKEKITALLDNKANPGDTMIPGGADEPVKEVSLAGIPEKKGETKDRVTREILTQRREQRQAVDFKDKILSRAVAISRPFVSSPMPIPKETKEKSRREILTERRIHREATKTIRLFSELASDPLKNIPVKEKKEKEGWRNAIYLGTERGRNAMDAVEYVDFKGLDELVSVTQAGFLSLLHINDKILVSLREAPIDKAPLILARDTPEVKDITIPKQSPLNVDLPTQIPARRESLEQVTERVENYNITINALPGEDAEALWDRLEREIQKRQRANVYDAT